jgi:hypothetical protein
MPSRRREVIMAGEHRRLMTKNLRTAMYALVGVFTVFLIFEFAGGLLPESTFQLASESRLPKWIAPPSGLNRKEVSLEMSYYTKLWGSDAKFTLKDSNGRILENLNGKVKCNGPIELKKPPAGFEHSYPSYEAITVNGITEIIEHRRTEPIFYIVDDPAVLKEISAIGCG